MTKEEKLKLVAEFDGKEVMNIPQLRAVFIGNKIQLNALKYHTSWDWQIPVWAKLVELDKEDGRVTMGVIKLGKYHDYYQSVSDNNPTAGFEIIVSIIQKLKI